MDFMKKLTEILCIIGVCLVAPSGIFAIIYELFIWDKSIVPDWLFNTTLAVGAVGVLLILPIVIYGYKHRMD